LLLGTVHPGNAGIGLNALLELVVDLNHSVADLVNLIALPGNRQGIGSSTWRRLPLPAPAAMFRRA
jgi:hypothetical protein